MGDVVYCDVLTVEAGSVVEQGIVARHQPSSFCQLPAPVPFLAFRRFLLKALGNSRNADLFDFFKLSLDLTYKNICANAPCARSQCATSSMLIFGCGALVR